MRRLGRIACLAVLLNISPALAIINPCSITGLNSFSPWHPLPGDDIHFSVGLAALGSAYPPYTGPPRTVISKVVVASDQVTVDVIVTNDTTPFTDYEVDTVTDGLGSAQGRIGPLPVGTYTVTQTLRQYDGATHAFTPVCDVVRTAILTVYGAPPATARVIEFHNPGLDQYFMSLDAAEVHDLDAGVHPGWVRTGQSFRAYLPSATHGFVPRAYRFYGLPSAGLDTHVFTHAVSAEAFNFIARAGAPAWRLETDDAFEIDYPSYEDGRCPTGDIPVFRLWKRLDSGHRYTTDPSIKADMVAKGWVPEGYGDQAVYFCALPDP